MDIGHQYPVEVLPTVARGQGIGAMQTVGFLCGFSSPYIAYLSKFGPAVPYVVLGVITVTGGFACLLLPETLSEKLPDTLEEGESFFAGQGLCHNPCARRNKISAGDGAGRTTDPPSGGKQSNDNNAKGVGELLAERPRAAGGNAKPPVTVDQRPINLRTDRGPNLDTGGEKREIGLKWWVYVYDASLI
ncbi:glucose transporter 1 [Penaeus vannamei]|uniref:Glucose transporter 1 n=1 Tax=Penaeus vannamei TaxID=6689 RepID=A0A423TZQ5_PENVA|nr:glucose transporter 1 [Penaeus vannamei]